MMKKLNSSVECIGVNFPRAVIKSYQRRIDKWLTSLLTEVSRSDSDLSTPVQPPHFHLTLEREAGHLCSCDFELFFGDRTIHIQSSANDPQTALTRCLAQTLRLASTIRNIAILRTQEISAFLPTPHTL